MRIIYKGVDLGVIQTHYCHFESVYDDSGVDYLYTRVSLAVRAIVNGQADVLNPQTGNLFNGPPISYSWGPGTAPPESAPVIETELKNKPTGKGFNGSPVDLIVSASTSVAESAPLGPIRDPFAGVIGPITTVGPKDPLPAAVKKDLTEKGGGRLVTETDGGKLVADVAGCKPREDPKVVPPYNKENNTAPNVGIDAGTKSKLRSIRRVPNAAPLSLQVVRHRLTTPRGKLYVFSGPGQEVGAPKPGTDDRPKTGVLLLEAPTSMKFPTDCNNGPKPQLLSVVEPLGGDNSILIDWACEAYINEAELNGVECTGALLSNRFSNRHFVDENGYTTIFTVGDAIFRTDLVFGDSFSPDSIRNKLFLPILPGFVRENIDVTGRPDVTGVHYEFQDRQVPVNFTAGPYCQAASITAIHREVITSAADVTGSVFGGITQTIGTLANLKVARSVTGDTAKKIGGMTGMRAPRPKGTGRLKTPGGGTP